MNECLSLSRVILLSFFIMIKYVIKSNRQQFELQYVGLEVENIRHRVTSNPNIANQRIYLIKLKVTLKITLQYKTLESFNRT